jgi:hypothetical protein
VILTDMQDSIMGMAHAGLAFQATCMRKASAISPASRFSAALIFVGDGVRAQRLGNHAGLVVG